MSRYMVSEMEDGFVVKGRPHPLDVPGQPDWVVELAYDYGRYRRTPVTVLRKRFYLETEPRDYFCFCDFYGLLRQTASSLLSSWAPPDRPRDDGPEDDPDYEIPWLREWAIRQTSRAINKLVHPYWQQLLSQVDPTVLAVNKAVFSAAFGYGPANILMQEELYREKFIVKDILTYRAAAIAARLCPVLGGRKPDLEKMAHWRSLFCPDGDRPNGILNKTLDGLPGGVPPKLLCRLRWFALPRPITNRLELITTLLAGGRDAAQNFRPIAFSNAGQIAEAMQKVSRFLHQDLSPRRWRDVQQAVQFLVDYPDRHTGHVVALAEKSIRWHRDHQHREQQKVLDQFGQTTELAKPPVPIPGMDGVTLLKTIKDVVDEGVSMGHCIAAYAERAVQGRCYLFHIDHEGETASVEVNPFGVVIQAQGPRNRNNNAATWGKRVLTQWGRQLRQDPQLGVEPDR